ncbi:MAG: transcription termination/antitermination protein NusA [Firmicutes bacterium]|nr:transcription termination/antitermination protein NusA [Bacillota bacterium]
MNEFIQALEQLQKEKGIDKEIVFSAIETSLKSACSKNFGTSANVRVNMDRENGTVKVYADKTVVEHVMDPALEISQEDAMKYNPSLQLGDICVVEITPRNFGRIAAQNAKQVVVQKIREAEREIIYNEYKSKERDIVSGLIQHKEKKNVYVNLGRIEALLTQQEQVPTESYKINQRLRVYILEVKNTPKGPIMIASRTHPDLVKRLFEQEVPEIHDGIVQIKSIAREPGSRTKMAVWSRDAQVDPLGACVGEGSARVNAITNELNGEKVDIVLWSDKIDQFIAQALSPAKITSVDVDEEGLTAEVIVPDDQLSLAIGKEGQNARLAARLTSFKIDIKSESQAEEEARYEEEYYGDEEIEYIYEDELENYDGEYVEVVEEQ